MGDVHADRGDLALAHPHARRACGRAWCAASTPASPSAATIARSIVRMYSGTLRHVHDRVADELPGPVVGELAAARGAHDVDAALAVEGLAERQVASSVRRPTV